MDNLYTPSSYFSLENPIPLHTNMHVRPVHVYHKIRRHIAKLAPRKLSMLAPFSLMTVYSMWSVLAWDGAQKDVTKQHT